MATTTLGTPGRKSRSMTTIYWIIAFVVVIGLIAFLASRSRTMAPTGTQGTVNTQEPSSGEIGASGAATNNATDSATGTEAPARQNDTDQR